MPVGQAQLEQRRPRGRSPSASFSLVGREQVDRPCMSSALGRSGGVRYQNCRNSPDPDERLGRRERRVEGSLWQHAWKFTGCYSKNTRCYFVRPQKQRPPGMKLMSFLKCDVVKGDGCRHGLTSAVTLQVEVVLFKVQF